MSPASKRPSTQRAIRAHDAGLRKVTVTTHVLLASAVGATGLFTALAALAQPGRSAVAGAAATRQALRRAPVRHDDGGGGEQERGTDSGLTPPAAAPTPDYQYSAPPVVSGAS